MAYIRVLVGTAEMAIFGAAAWPLLRICANHGFQQKLRVFPLVGVTIVVALIGYSIALACLWRFVPVAFHAAALLLGAAIAYERFRARPRYGCARGLPPGSLALAPIAPWNDYLFYQKQAERYGSVFKMSHFTTPMVCVVGLKQAVELLRTYDEDLSVPPLPFSRYIPGGFMRYMDKDLHQRYTAIFRAMFTRDVIVECEPYIAQIAHRGFSEMAEACAKTPGAGVNPKASVRNLNFVIFARLFFGLPPNTDTFRRMQSLFQLIDYHNAWRTPAYRVSRALDDLVLIVQEIGEKASGCFLAEALRANPSALRDRTFVMNLIYIMLTGSGDVAGLLQWIIKKLSDHPEWVVRLRENLSASTMGEDRASALASRIVRETLRLEQSEYLMRQTLREIRVGEYVIPRGWHLRVCVRESHRSDELFEDAAAFNPDRFLTLGNARAAYSPFGASRIACMGEHLTLAIGRVFVTELVRGFHWKVISDGPREYGSFHWTPSSRFRLALLPWGENPYPVKIKANLGDE